MDTNNEENSGAEQVEMRKLSSFDVVSRRIQSEQLPPSPPLTRVPTHESTSTRIPPLPLENDDERQGLEEIDIVDHHWHPLRLTQEDSLSLHDVHFSSEMDEKRPSRTPRRPAHLNLEFRKPSPQPWDTVDPPPQHSGRLEHGFYSPLQSTTYATQQNTYVILLKRFLCGWLIVARSRPRPLIPHSAYYNGPPPSNSAYGTPPVGQIGVHFPREIVRVERDYVGGELIQFSSIYPIELEGRVLDAIICTAMLIF